MPNLESSREREQCLPTPTRYHLNSEQSLPLVFFLHFMNETSPLRWGKDVDRELQGFGF